MYLRDGKPMQYKEEGAAFFQPISMGQFVGDSAPPVDMTGSGTRAMTADASTSSADGGAPASPPSGASAPSNDSSSATPWWVFAAGALGGFFLYKRRRQRS